MTRIERTEAYVAGTGFDCLFRTFNLVVAGDAYDGVRS